jgi:hypothetical protein
MEYEKTPYLRCGTSFFKRSFAPTITGEKIELLLPWNIDTIKQDEGRDYIGQIPKFDGFVCIPNHIDYKQVYDNYYNTYRPLSHILQEGNIEYSLTFIRHIFGNQYELGLDYLQLLYTNPVQMLPILCLVSRERATGKSTFLKWLKLIFEGNLTYLTNDSFSSQFNSDWANKLLICIDEVLFKKEELTERIKFLSTTNINKMEAKGRDKVEVDFFGKFVLCSNNEKSFIKIDSDEIRFWIIKVVHIEKENTNLLIKLKNEIPAFLHFLQKRQLNVRKPLSRMWFSPSQIRTNALERLLNHNNHKVELPILEVLYEIFQEISDDMIYICPKDILFLLERNKKYITVAEIRNILKRWGFLPESNTKSYKGYNLSCCEYYLTDRRGRYYTINKKSIVEKYDALMHD